MARRLLVFAILLVFLVYVCQARPQDARQESASYSEQVSKFLSSTMNGAKEKLSEISHDIVSNESVNNALKNTWKFAGKVSENIKKTTKDLFDK